MSIIDLLKNQSPEQRAESARKIIAITPHNTNELTYLPRQIYIGGAGDLCVIMADDSVEQTFKNLPEGMTLNIRPKIVKSTGTSATYILGLI